MVTVIMIDIPVLFSGAVITETVFAWPGMGTLFYDSLNKQDYPILMGVLMINAVLVILSNLLATQRSTVPAHQVRVRGSVDVSVQQPKGRYCKA